MDIVQWHYSRKNKIIAYFPSLISTTPQKKFLVRQPHFELTTVGLAASMSDGSQPTPAGAILASDVQLLLMYLMMGDKMQAADIG